MSERNLALGDTVVETTPSGFEHVYTVTAVDVQPKKLLYAPPGRYVVISRNHVHHTMRQETIFEVDWMRRGRCRTPVVVVAAQAPLEQPQGSFILSRSKPRLLDLFCGAGGAAMGYHLAGFDVLGVDIVEQPNYPFDFHRADAMDLLRCDIPALGFDAIHASPPCQGYSVLKGLVGEPQDYPKLIAEVRERLQATGLPWVIENVGGARSDLRNPIQLCGSSFGLRVWRHRLFEMCHPPPLVPPCSHRLHPEPIDVTGSGGPTRPGRTRTGGGASRKPKDLADARDAMGIDWMNRSELSEAIPPAMTEWLGHHLLAHVQREAKAA